MDLIMAFQSNTVQRLVPVLIVIWVGAVAASVHALRAWRTSRAP